MTNVNIQNAYELRETGLTYQKIANKLNVSLPTIYNALRNYQPKFDKYASQYTIYLGQRRSFVYNEPFTIVEFYEGTYHQYCKVEYEDGTVLSYEIQSLLVHSLAV